MNFFLPQAMSACMLLLSFGAGLSQLAPPGTCDAGFYAITNDTADPDCRTCPSGSSCACGDGTPLLCAPGTTAATTGLSECVPCEGGSYQDLSGATGCEPCLPGQFCPKGASAPLPCKAGSYSEATNLTAAGECTACPAGCACSMGSIDPTPCFPGFFAATEGQPNCVPCPPGTSSGQGSDACDECEAGTYAAMAGWGRCLPCPHPLSSADGSVTCSFCMEYYFLRDPTSWDPHFRRHLPTAATADPDDIFKSPTEYCKACPPNAACPDNTTLASLVLPSGFWRASPSSAVLTECRLFGGNANAGKKRCAGSEPVARGRRMAEAGSEYCAPGFAGPECQLCAAENHNLVDGDECKECAPRGAAAGRIVGLVLGLCVACGLAAYCYSMTSWRKKPCIGGPLRLADRASALYVKLGPTPKIKIMFAFYQIVLVLSSTYSARLPDKYTGLTDPLANVVALDWSGLFLPEQCLGYELRLLAIALAPVAFIALMMIAGISLRLQRWRAAPAPRARPWYAEAALGLLDLTPAGLVFAFFFVPSITASIFRSWSCQAAPS